MLESLRETIPENLTCEIILIDDLSSDGTRPWMATLGDPSIKTLFNSTNLGYARSNNAAAGVAIGEILALVNNDLVFAPGWLEPMLGVLEDQALNAGLVGNVQFRMRDNSLDHAGICVTPLGKIEHLHSLPDNQRDHAKVFAVTGACCLITKADFERLGGFDEAYVNGGEDVDLCLRLRESGKQTYVARGSTIRHHVSLSRDRHDVQNERNSRRIYMKWRREIKDELTRQWALLLQEKEIERYRDYFDGEVNPALLATPHAIARVIAESVIQQEESYWEHELDGTDRNANLAACCRAWGVHFCEEESGYLINGTAELSVAGVSSVRSCFVCGRKVGSVGSRTIALTISVNDIQEKTCVLGREPNFNIGIVRPIFLPGGINRVTVSANFINPKDGQRLGDAGSSILITHFVVDDRVIENLGG